MGYNYLEVILLEMHTFSKLRNKTTHKAHHHLTNKLNWYKKWHDFKYSHHIHVGVILFIVFSALLAVLTLPTNVFAALTQQTKTITSEAQFNQGTLTDTGTNGDQVELDSFELSNDGGGNWDYRKKITIDNAAGFELTDYQIPVDSEEGLVGHWNFDEGTGTTANDSSWSGNNGTMNGSSYWTADGRYGNAFNGNGSSNYVNLGNPDSLRITGDLTIEAWIKRGSSSGVFQIIAGKWQTSSTKSYALYFGSDNKLGMYISKNGIATNRAYFRTDNTYTSTTEWYHVVGVYKSGASPDIDIYVNGSPATGTITSAGTWDSIYDSSSNVQVSKGGDGDNSYFNGSVDEVKIYNSNLPDTEIWNNYQQQKPLFFNDVKSDGSDIRFTDFDGKTELNYWIEELNNTATGKKNYKAWVKTNVPASSSKDIYMYYGNSSATASSYNNGDNVFELFVDKNDIAGWTAGGYTIDENEGSIYIHGSVAVGSATYDMNPSGGKYIVDWSNKTALTGGGKGVYANLTDSSKSIAFGWREKYDDNDACYYRAAAVDYLLYNGFSYDKYYIYSAVVDESIKKIDYYFAEAGGNILASALNKDYIDTSATTVSQFSINDGASAAAQMDVWIRYIRVRQYTSSPPTITQSGGLARMPYKKDIGFDTTAGGADVSTDQYDFPIAVHINTSSWSDQGERDTFFDNAGTDGKGVQFWESDESHALDYEVEYFDNTQGNEEAIYWVRVPKIDGNSNTDKIIVSYGRDTGQDEDNQTGVWINGYAAVYHMGDDSWAGGSPEATDSTSNNIDGINSGSTDIDGYVRRGRSFNGTSNQIHLDNLNTVMSVSTGTISAWFKADDLGDNGGMAGQYSATGPSRVYLLSTSGDIGWKLGSDNVFRDTGVNTNQAWQRATLTWDGTNGRGYVDGVLKNTVGYSNLTTFADVWTIGNVFLDYSYWFDGDVDETRFSSTKRSDDWVKLSYVSTAKASFSGDTLISFGSQASANYQSFGYSINGSYLSPDDANTIDFSWTGGWGSGIVNFEADVTIPGAEESIVFEARTSPDKSSWTSWENLGTATSTGTFQDNGNMDNLTVESGSGNYRYIQVKATLASSDGGDTPVLEEYRVIYYTDLNAPVNPTGATSYTDLGKTTEITNNSWTNETTPYFEWTGYSDNDPAESGVDCFYVYFGTSDQEDPKTAGLDGATCYSDANLDFSTLGTNPLDSATSGETYYLRIDTKDVAGNVQDMPNGIKLFTYKFDDVVPTNPTSISRTPIGYTSVDDFDFDWPHEGEGGGGSDDNATICGYEYKRDNGLDSWSYTTNSDVSGILSYQQGANTFQVRSRDCAGNVASAILELDYYFSDAAPSEPTNLLVDGQAYVQKDENSFTFTWDEPLDINGGTIEEYCYSVNAVPTAQNTVCASSETTGAIAAATIQGDNTFYVVAKNTLNNINYDNHESILFGADTTAPSIPGSAAITDSSNRAIPQWSLTTSWNYSTGNIDHYNIYRSADGTNWDPAPVATTDAGGYFDSGLTQGGTYYYKVTAEDDAGAESAASSIVSDEPTGKYTSPPSTVTGPEATTTAVGAVITWSTDRASSSFVEYSTDDSYNLSNGSLTPVTSHTVELSGLAPGTTYNFRTQSLDEERDYAASTAYSSNFTLTTSQAPGISEVEVSDASLTSAIVTWKTTSSATSAIKYGKTTSYGTTITDHSGSSVTTHTIKLADLSHSSSYHFKISGTDIDDNYMESDDYVFNTLIMPRVFNVRFEQQTNTATSTLKVTWESNVPLSSVVKFTPSQGGATKEVSSSKLLEKHSMLVSGLIDNTDYTMSVEGRDAYGNQASSDANKVRTDFDTRPPEVSAVFVDIETAGLGLDSKGQAVISWETDEKATSQVEYEIGITGEEYSYKTQEDNLLSTTHVVVISDLKPATTYHFKVVSRDASDNTGYSEDSYFLTEQATESIFGLIARYLEQAIGWLFRL